MAYPENTGGVAADQLCSIVDRVERLREEIAALNADVSEVYKEARGNGFDVRTLKALISERAKIAKDPAVYQENESLLDLYRDAVNRGTAPATRARARSPNSAPSNQVTRIGETDEVPAPSRTVSSNNSQAKASRDETDIPAGAASDGLASRESGGSGSVAPNSNPAPSPPDTDGVASQPLSPATSSTPIEPLEIPVSEGSTGGADIPVTAPPGPDIPTFLDRRSST